MEKTSAKQLFIPIKDIIIYHEQIEKKLHKFKKINN